MDKYYWIGVAFGFLIGISLLKAMANRIKK